MMDQPESRKILVLDTDALGRNARTVIRRLDDLGAKGNLRDKVNFDDMCRGHF